MSSCSERPYAALMLPDADGLDPDLYLHAAEHVLARRDKAPGASPCRDDTQTMVIGYRYAVRVTPEPVSDYGPRIHIEVVGTDGLPPDMDEASEILSDVVLLSLQRSEADILEWFEPGVLIDREDFVRLRSHVNIGDAETYLWPQEESAMESTQGIRDALYHADDTAAAQPPINDPLTAYRERMANAEPQEKRIRAAGWAMTSALSFAAFPVAIALATVGLFRGMDFRLVTQATAVTMLFVVLSNSDRLNKVLSFFQ